MKKIFKIINNLDFIIFTCTTIISIYSIIIIYSAKQQNINIFHKKIIHIIICSLIMFILSKIKSKFYKKNSNIFYIIFNLLLLFVLIHGNISKGAQRWIDLKIIKFQPSELAKIIIPISIASKISNSYPIKNKHVLYSVIIIIIPTILTYIQPDLGTSVLILISGFTVLFLGGINKKHIFIISVAISIMIPILWNFFLYDYQKKRIINLINHNNKTNQNYHINQSLIAIGSGGLYGKGILYGTQSTFNFIPEKHTDFIFTVIAEENGFIGICILLFIYILLITTIIKKSIKIKNNFSKLIVSNYAIIIYTYICINIGMVTGIFPIVGITLPLISHGGSSLLSIMSMLGIIISITKKKK